MANLAGYLICPRCQNKNQFTILASVELQVQGANYLAPFAETGPSYGSLSPCVCTICAYADKLEAFIRGVTTLAHFISDQDAPTDTGHGATVLPLRPPHD